MSTAVAPSGVMPDHPPGRLLELIRIYVKQDRKCKGSFPTCELEDVVQSAALDYLQWERLEGSGPPRAIDLDRVGLVANRACSRARSKRAKRQKEEVGRGDELLKREATARGQDWVGAEARELRRAIEAELQTVRDLPCEIEATIFRLHYDDERTFRDIGPALDITFQRAQRVYARVRRCLRGPLTAYARAYPILADLLDIEVTE